MTSLPGTTHLPLFLASTFTRSTAQSPAAWFVVRVREKYRALAEELFVAQGIAFFSPMITEVHQWSDRRKPVRVPLFSGYVFCRFNPQHHVAILRTLGVIDIVRSGAKFSEVNPRELQAIEQALGSQQPVQAIPNFAAGPRVRVGSGPMKNVEGVLLEGSPHCKLVLSVGRMDRSLAVEVKRSQIEAAA